MEGCSTAFFRMKVGKRSTLLHSLYFSCATLGLPSRPSSSSTPKLLLSRISASARVLGWPRMGYESETYWAKVTYDASAEGGSAPACVANVKAAWKAIAHSRGNTGWPGKPYFYVSNVHASYRPLPSVFALIIFHLNAWDTMASECECGRKHVLPTLLFPDAHTRNHSVQWGTIPTPPLTSPVVLLCCRRIPCVHRASFLPTPASPWETRGLSWRPSMPPVPCSTMQLKTWVAILSHGLVARRTVVRADPFATCCALSSAILPRFRHRDYQYCTELMPEETASD